MFLVTRKVKELDFEKGTILKGLGEVVEIKDSSDTKDYETEADAICAHFKECVNMSLDITIKGRSAFYLLLRELFHKMSAGKLSNEVPWFRVIGLVLDKRVKVAMESEEGTLEDEVYRICYPMFKIPFESDRVVDYEEVLYFEKLMATLCSLAIVKDEKYNGIQKLPLLQIANNFCAMFQCRYKEIKKQKIVWCGERDLFVNFVNYNWGTIRRYTGLPMGCVINPVKEILAGVNDEERGIYELDKEMLEEGKKCLLKCKGAGRFDDYKVSKFPQAVWVGIETDIEKVIK